MIEKTNSSKANSTLSLSTFFCLYIAQMVPSSFLMTALQVMMREGHYSLTTIGLLNLVRLPWLLKLFWSPLVDRHCLTVANIPHIEYFISHENILPLHCDKMVKHKTMATHHLTYKNKKNNILCFSG